MKFDYIHDPSVIEQQRFRQISVQLFALGEQINETSLTDLNDKPT